MIEHWTHNLAVEVAFGAVAFIVACKAATALWRYMRRGASYAIPDGVVRSSALGLAWMLLGALSFANLLVYMDHFQGKPSVVNPQTFTSGINDLYIVVGEMMIVFSVFVLVFGGLLCIGYGASGARAIRAVGHGTRDLKERA